MVMQEQYKKFLREDVTVPLEETIKDIIDTLKKMLPAQSQDLFISLLLDNLVKLNAREFTNFLNKAPIDGNSKVYLASLHENLHEQDENKAISVNQIKDSVTKADHLKAVKGFIMEVFEDQRKLLKLPESQEYRNKLKLMQDELNGLPSNDSWQNNANSHKVLAKESASEASHGFIEGINPDELTELMRMQYEYEVSREGVQPQAQTQQPAPQDRDLELEAALAMSMQAQPIVQNEVIDPDLAQALAISMHEQPAPQARDLELEAALAMSMQAQPIVQQQAEEDQINSLKKIQFYKKIADLERFGAFISDEEYSEHLAEIMGLYADLNLSN
jgi:hypothetical protein